MIRYATNTERWEEWMLEYRFGAFYIFPPDGIIESIDALRRKYDPKSAEYCQAHISLSEPLQQPLSEIQIQEMQAALGAMTTFDLHYGPLRSFPPYPGVVYSIQPEDKFQQVRAVIHATYPFTG